MKDQQPAPKKDEKLNATVRPDRTDTSAPEGGRNAAAGQLSDDDLQSIAGGPTMVERRP